LLPPKANIFFIKTKTKKASKNSTAPKQTTADLLFSNSLDLDHEHSGLDDLIQVFPIKIMPLFKKQNQLLQLFHSPKSKIWPKKSNIPRWKEDSWWPLFPNHFAEFS
jgi:hypothetical protein